LAHFHRNNKSSTITQSRAQSPMSLHKVKTHRNMQANEEASKLAKQRIFAKIIQIAKHYENAHSSLY